MYLPAVSDCWRSLASAVCRDFDGRLRAGVASCIHSLVAGLLVFALVIGAFGMVVFLSVRIGQESRAAVIAATDAARSWTTAPASSGLLAQARPATVSVSQCFASMAPPLKLVCCADAVAQVAQRAAGARRASGRAKLAERRRVG